MAERRPCGPGALRVDRRLLWGQQVGIELEQAGAACAAPGAKVVRRRQRFPVAFAVHPRSRRHARIRRADHCAAGIRTAIAQVRTIQIAFLVWAGGQARDPDSGDLQQVGGGAPPWRFMQAVKRCCVDLGMGPASLQSRSRFLAAFSASVRAPVRVWGRAGLPPKPLGLGGRGPSPRRAAADGVAKGLLRWVGRQGQGQALGRENPACQGGVDGPLAHPRAGPPLRILEEFHRKPSLGL